MSNVIPFDRNGRKRFFVLPSQDQLITQIDAICPPEICPNNAGAAVAMMSSMFRGLQAHLAAEGGGGNGEPLENPDAIQSPGIIGKVKSYAKAKLGPPASAELQQLRLSLCQHGGVACPKHRKWAIYDQEADEWKCPEEDCDWKISRQSATDNGSPSCPFMVTKDNDEQYCTRCGCAHKGDAELSKKSGMLEATCPRELWPKEVAADVEV